MNAISELSNTGINIAAVERETGIGKDTLRVWERRYGFPQPERDGNGDRLYPPEQISRLRLIRRLMDRGHRPGRLVGATADALRELASGGLADEAPANPSANESAAAAAGVGGRAGRVAAAFERLLAHDVAGLRAVLSQWLAQEGLMRFVMDSVPELSRRVGDGWQSGRVQIFEEHLYSQQMHALLRQAIAGLAPGTRRPTVLLTTVPDELHDLGILLLEALLTLQGVRSVSLGTQTPVAEIVAGAAAHRADIVALSFSGAFPSRQVMPVVEQLRLALPAHVHLWLGGAGVGKGFEKQLERRRERAGEGGFPALEGIQIGHSLADALTLADRGSVPSHGAPVGAG